MNEDSKKEIAKLRSRILNIYPEVTITKFLEMSRVSPYAWHCYKTGKTSPDLQRFLEMTKSVEELERETES